ncbi:MAG: hypothetical protein LBL58_19180 [Tannerellaceae bacterium]|jgi:hypothetical protein|nr:hypothetical protein [Tannerellaceae bacterium]
MKELNDISRTGGYPITAEVLEALNNAKYFDYLMQLFRMSDIRNSWCWLIPTLGLFVHFDRIGFAKILQCGQSLLEIIKISDTVKNNRKAYYISYDYQYTNISKEDGTEMYEDTILIRKANILEAAYVSSPDTYYTSEELIHGIWNDILIAGINFQSIGFDVISAKIRYNDLHKKLTVKFKLRHNYTYNTRVILTSPPFTVGLPDYCPLFAMTGDIEMAVNGSNNGAVNMLPAYIRKGTNTTEFILDYSAVTVAQFITVIDATIDL